MKIYIKYKMLNESEITLVESVYLVLDRDVLTYEIALPNTRLCI